MIVSLEGDTAIVTGAGRGIGKAIAQGLLSEGVNVAAIDVGKKDLEKFTKEVEKIYPNSFVGCVCDIRDEEGMKEVAESVAKKFGSVDILVNNAGVVGNGPLAELSEETWDFVHDVNLKGTFLACKAVIPYMKRQRKGRIVNASSFAAISPIYGSGAYASSKAAVAHFSRALAAELGPWSITVNAYAPGMIPTAMNGFAELPQAEQERLLSTLALKKWGSTGDIVSLVCFLASSCASYITGTLVDVSGGKLISQIPSLAYDAYEGI